MLAVIGGSVPTMREEPGLRDAMTENRCSVIYAPFLTRLLILVSLAILVAPHSSALNP